MNTPITSHSSQPLSQQESSLEALLFVSVDPVPTSTLSRLLEIDVDQTRQLLQSLMQRYQAEQRGFLLRELAGGWQLATAPVHHQLIETYVQRWDTHKLSDASLEVLAVVAYHQPITREGVRAIRGVNSDGVISSLVDKGLIKAVGREKSLGAALLYATTSTFLHTFGLSSLKELPSLEQFAPDEESKALIRERLGAHFAPTSQLISSGDNLDGDDEYQGEDKTNWSTDCSDKPALFSSDEEGDNELTAQGELESSEGLFSGDAISDQRPYHAQSREV